MKMWIARDSYGGLFIYINRPVRKEMCFNAATAYESVMGLPWDFYPEVTFENSPKEVELVIKKKTCRGCLHYENHCPFIAEQNKRGELGCYPNRVCGEYKNREEQ